jgi:hypothetical protein
MENVPLFKALGEEGRTELAALKTELKTGERETFEVSMLRAIDEAVDARQGRKALSVIGMYRKRYPNSIVNAQLEELEAWLKATLCVTSTRR